MTPSIRPSDRRVLPSLLIFRFGETGMPSGHRDLLVWRILSYLPRNVRGVKPDLLLAPIRRGDITHLNYDDLERLAQELRFREVGGRDSHRVFAHPDLPELVNLQVGRGQAKRYGSGRWRPGTPVRFVVEGAMNPGLMFGVHGAQRPIREIINKHLQYIT